MVYRKNKQTDHRRAKGVGSNRIGFRPSVLGTTSFYRRPRPAPLHKFPQHPGLRHALAATGDKIFAEAASSHDLIWGIGYKAGGPRASHQPLWRGFHLPRHVLMEVRQHLARPPPHPAPAAVPLSRLTTFSPGRTHSDLLWWDLPHRQWCPRDKRSTSTAITENLARPSPACCRRRHMSKRCRVVGRQVVSVLGGTATSYVKVMSSGRDTGEVSVLGGTALRCVLSSRILLLSWLRAWYSSRLQVTGWGDGGLYQSPATPTADDHFWDLRDTKSRNSQLRHQVQRDRSRNLPSCLLLDTTSPHVEAVRLGASPSPTLLYYHLTMRDSLDITYSIGHQKFVRHFSHHLRRGFTSNLWTIHTYININA